MATTWTGPSPFVHDGPLPPEELIGRDAEADALRAWARAGRFVALVAPRRYGKTSLIGKVARDAEAADRIAVVRADLFEVASTADLVIRLERAWAQHTPQRLREAVARVLAGAQVGLSIAGTGFTVALAERPGTDPLPALHTLLDLPNRLAGAKDHARVLVVLDEFQSLARVEGAEALLRSHAQHQRETASYLFAGSEPSMIAAAFGERSRPFYGQAEVFRLGRLGDAELADAIGDRFERSGRHAGPVLQELVRAAEGHPQRAMLLAHLLWTQVPEGQVATAEHWDAALTTALRRVDAEARAVLAGLPTGERKALRAVAEYGTPLSARALRTLDLPKTTAARAAQVLLGEGLLERDDDGWRLVDPLLARWLRRELPTRTAP
ncbi:MAG TPA: hypothetical protein VNU66_05460 [Mycobacteriales bacterium]|nr:hypothetical protein [Mycobacteriales bacterium]